MALQVSWTAPTDIASATAHGVIGGIESVGPTDASPIQMSMWVDIHKDLAACTAVKQTIDRQVYAWNYDPASADDLLTQAEDWLIANEAAWSGATKV